MDAGGARGQKKDSARAALGGPGAPEKRGSAGESGPLGRVTGAMLCYAMLCYAMLCNAMLCYAMLCYAIIYILCIILKLYDNNNNNNDI